MMLIESDSARLLGSLSKCRTLPLMRPRSERCDVLTDAASASFYNGDVFRGPKVTIGTVCQWLV